MRALHREQGDGPDQRIDLTETAFDFDHGCGENRMSDGVFWARGTVFHAPMSHPALRRAASRHSQTFRQPFLDGTVRMTDTTLGVQSCLDRLRRGDASARDEVIVIACNRITVLARKMLNNYSRLRRYEQTDDISQN